MKRCSYCGKEYPDSSRECSIDGKPLEGGEGLPSREEQVPAPRERIDLNRIPAAFLWREGYSRPDWKVIRTALEQTVLPENRPEAWTEAALQWMERLQQDLGGDYRVARSSHCALLSEQKTDPAGQLLKFVEESLWRIQAFLREAACQSGSGPHVILLFSEEDDYYEYIAAFYPDGSHPSSRGVLLKRGYVHIALPALDGHGLRLALAHELTHGCVAHLALPAWLNEGLAMRLQRAIAGSGHPVLDGDLQARHLAFWNPQTIQQFWAGLSFHTPGEACQLSYSLAEILLTLLPPQAEAFRHFILQSRREDAGQTAALDCLNTDLGEAAALFLGKGPWRPSRKAIADSWVTARSAKSGTDRGAPPPSPGNKSAWSGPER